jgi:formylmethanofuran dehydrogenase subunit C
VKVDTITLTLTKVPEGRIRVDVVTPDRLATMSNREIGALPVWLSRGVSDGASAPRHMVHLGEVFSIQGERASTVRVSGPLAAVDGLGAEMASGSLTIEGDVGHEVGRRMRGGSILVRGSTGADAGLAMTGGSLTITGDAGDRLGAPLPGASSGMTGGEIFVHGNSGRDSATGVRRGLVVVGGNTVDAGRAMIAGTLLVGGRIAGTVGQWNKRGSIVTVGGADVPLSYRYACTYRPPLLNLLFHYLRARGVPVDERIATGRYARYCGDLSQVGKGELLLWLAPPNLR